MNRLFEKSKGAISILLALVMLPMFTFAGLIIDGARIESAKSAAQGAGELALNAGLSEYDQTLLSVYGLFSLSSTPAELEMNLKMYFSNTLSAQSTDLESGSATKDALDAWSQDIVDGLFQGSTGTDDQTLSNVSNMTEMQTADFKAVGVAESTLDHPEVLERQIIEYMKYRGPVSLASGFMEKINILGAIPQQTAAVDAKVDYEKQMSTVQDACDKAYEAIEAYKKHLTETTYQDQNSNTAKFIGDPDPNNAAALNVNIDNMFGNVRQWLEGATRSYIDLNTIGTRKPVDSYAVITFDTTGVSKANATADDYIDRYETLRDELSIIFAISDPTLYFWNGEPSGDRYYDVIWLWNNNINNSKISEFLTLIKYMHDNQSDVDPEYEYIDEAMEYQTYFTTCQTECDTRIADLKGTIGASVIAAEGWLKDFYDYSGTVITNLTASIAALEEIKTVSAALKAKGEVWEGKNAELPGGETQDSMNQDLASKSGAIDDAQIDALIAVLDGNLQYFTSVQTAIKGITYYGDTVYTDTPSASTDAAYNRFLGNVTTQKTYITTKSVTTSNGKKLQLPGWQVTSIDLAAQKMVYNYVGKSTADLVPAQYTVLDRNAVNQEFYQYLLTTCSQGVTESTTSSDNAKSQKDALNGVGNSTASATDPVPGQPAVSSGSIPALEAVITGTPYVNNKVDSGSSDEAAADANTANMANTAGQMGDISSILSGAAETLRDNLYLMEYITTMFSYNTVALDTDGGVITPTTLSNVPIDEKNNQFYRAEVEYILWGNAKASDNVLATQASIYGIRLVLNSIYAFTNAEIKGYTLTAATAIAGWTGFGVPIVQTVLIFALAAAESALDLMDLNSGKEVPIYKTTTSWILKPSSIFSSATGKLTEVAVTAIKNELQVAANKFFEKVAQVADKEITSIQAELDAFVLETEQSVLDSAVDTVMVPVEELARSIITSSENTTQDCEAYVTGQVDIMIADLVDNDYGDTPQGVAKKAVVDYLASSGKAILIANITECKQKYNAAVLDGVTDVTDEINGILESTFSYVIDQITQPVKAAIADVSSDFKAEVNSQLGGANEQAQKMIEDSANEYIGKMSNTGTTASPTNTSAPETADTAGKGGLTMTYEDYLKVFILLATLAEKDTMLKRVGNLIECNMKYSEGSANFKNGVRFEKNPSFEMSEAYTMFGINATVNVRTTFLGGISFLSSSDSSGNPTNEYTSILGAYWQPIEYHGVTSY